MNLPFAHAPRIPRWQFSLRSFFLATTVCGLGMTYVAQGQEREVRIWLVVDQQPLARRSHQPGPPRALSLEGRGWQTRRAIREWVVPRVLDRPDISRLPMVHCQVEPQAWLRDRLHVEAWGTGSLVRLRLAGRDPDQVGLILEAVAETYFAGIDGMSDGQRTSADVHP